MFNTRNIFEGIDDNSQKDGYKKAIGFLLMFINCLPLKPIICNSMSANNIYCLLVECIQYHKY